MSRTIVLGLDGACWPLLEPWLQAGDLPTLAALRTEATWGPLASQLPPVTSPNWRCYATGRNPGKLGVFWWEIVDTQQRLIRYPTSRDFATRPLWHDIATSGRRVAIINFPTGYPPEPIPNGYFTAGGPGAKDTGFAFPTTWEHTLRHQYKYRVHPADVFRSAAQVTDRLDHLLSLMQSRFHVAFDLLAQGVDFLHLTIFYINVLQHFCYQQQPTRAGWQLIDRNLERLWQLANTHGYNLFLMSDHGCAPVDTTFSINTWLAQEGFLRLKAAPGGARLRHWGLDRQRLAGLARRTGLGPLLRRLLPAAVQRAIPNTDGTFAQEAKGARIDWQNSLAIASGQGPIYILRTPHDPEYETIRNAIAAKLAALHNPTTGQPVATRVWQREEVYQGPFLGRAPDLIFAQGPGIHTSGGVGSSQVFTPPTAWAADNVPQGLFLAWGPDFFPQGLVQGTRIVDLLPTVLHLMGLPLPDDVDGSVLQHLLTPRGAAAQRPVTFYPAESATCRRPEDEEDAALRTRLRQLGYLD
jgi:predicted AlkP superfamily phosphohydrolase/phosphomutase